MHPSATPPPPPSLPPSPPAVTNGWGRHVAAALGDLTAWRDILHHRLTVVEERLHSIEIKPQAAQPPPPPSTGPKVDRAELLHEINSGLRTLIAAVLVIAVLLGRVSGETIEAVRKAISIAP